MTEETLIPKTETLTTKSNFFVFRKQKEITFFRRKLLF